MRQFKRKPTQRSERQGNGNGDNRWVDSKPITIFSEQKLLVAIIDVKALVDKLTFILFLLLLLYLF